MNITSTFCTNFCRLAMTFLFTTLFFGAVNAAVYTVTKTADTNDGLCNADCSLREAVTAANNTVNDDIIEFAPAVFATPQTISLNSDTLTIANNGTLTINGTGADRLSISGNNSVRVFFFTANSNILIRRMTIRNGTGFGQGGGGFGGGIASSTAISTLEDVVVSNNRTFTPDPGPAVVGGGISNGGGRMTIIRSRIESNINNLAPFVTSVLGGGIYNGFQGTLTIINSSITNNNVTGRGGGIYNETNSTLNLINSTVSGNRANFENTGIGGGIYNAGTMNVTHSTVAFNTASVADGGVSNVGASGVVNSRNSIYSNNTGGGNARDFRGTLTSGGYNLVKDTTDTVFIGDATGNILGQDPLLQPLTNSGGSFFHIPSPVSPAIDKGKTFDFFNDQRLLTRPFDDPRITNAPGGDGADIGSIELQITKFSANPPFDFDGDYRTDISIFRPSSGEWWINRSSTNVTTSTPFGTSTDKLVPADYSGDGKTDITFYRPSNGTWFSLSSENSTLTSFQFGVSEDFPTPGDFDGDGRADFAVYRPSQGTWYIRHSSNGMIVTRAFGIAEDQPVVADYDGDGKSDIAIYRPSVSEWWILRSSSGAFAVQFGQTGDRTVQGDYTGDGRADIAIWRPSNGFWYILRSEDSSYYAFPFGQLGDLPVPADYDGDGKYDVGVFRPSDTVWYLLKSTGGFSSQQFGVAGDQPIPNVFVRQ